MYKVVAYQVASSINIKSCKQQLSYQLLFQDSDELFYKYQDNAFVYMFQYGMVSFFNMSSQNIEDLLKQIKPNTSNYFSEKLSEATEVLVKPNTLKVQFNHIELPNLDQEMIRLVMLYASQSVALDRYSEITEELLEQTHQHTFGEI